VLSLKILIVTQYFWPETFIINDIVKTLVSQGHAVTVATGKPNYPDGKIFPGYAVNGVFIEKYLKRVDIFRIPVIPRGKGRGVDLIINYISFVLSGLFYFPRFFRQNTFDVIIVYAPSPITQVIPGILLKKLKGVHLAVWVQDLWPESLAATGFIRNRVLLEFAGFGVKMIYTSCDTLLLQSKGFFKPISRYANSKKLLYFPNSMDVDKTGVFLDYLTEDLSKELSANFSLVFAGNIGKAQGVETVVEAARLMREERGFRLIMVGSGSMLDWVRKKKYALQLDNLILPGRFPMTKMPAIFQRASALLVSLKSDEIFFHTIPSKVQAYLAAGRPIIVSMKGEAARVVNEAGAGFCCDPENAEALVNCIRKMMALPRQERDAMGAAGKRYFFEHFEMNCQVERITNILQKRI